MTEGLDQRCPTVLHLPGRHSPASNDDQSNSTQRPGGSIRSVVDTVRGSGLFHDVVGYTKAVKMLSQDGPDKPKILRTKDKITKPLPNGCE